MKSLHGDFFNHDVIAHEYDEDVLNESDPIRAGYDALLDWVSGHPGVVAAGRILDLGSGTGNLSLRLNGFQKLVCVDISEKMLEIARQKMAHLAAVEFVQSDLLGYFDGRPSFDAIISTYAIHHLTEDEKRLLFQKIYDSLEVGGAAVFGDLMFADKTDEERLRRKFAENDPGVVEAIDEEFFWNVDQATVWLQELGFTMELKRFSDLSWGVAATKAPE
jgi:putative AdoMet-dependent methyltransferase